METVSDNSISSKKPENPDNWALRLRYAMQQGTRTAWFMAHESLSKPVLRVMGIQPEFDAQTDLPLPGKQKLYADLQKLLAKDLSNIESGLYRMPRNSISPTQLLKRSWMYFSDLPEANARRENSDHDEVAKDNPDVQRPDYYMQNFHFQSDGWLSEKSAKLYDTQVEILFKGTAAVMRRQALVPLAEFMVDKDQRKHVLLDVACGTARFLGDVVENYPRLNVVGLDLSEPYLQEARKSVKGRRNVAFHVAKGEELPFADNSIDCLSCIFLFHELPPEIRARMAAEFARVLKPKGRLVFIDTLQMGDREDYDGLLDLFPQNFHEPYYAGYIRENLKELFAGAGLIETVSEQIFVSKLSVFDKPA